MKKLFLLSAICLSLSTFAQSKIYLKVSTQINTTNGFALSNAVADLTAHTETIQLTGKVQCDLHFYKDTISVNRGLDNFYPAILTQGGKIQTKVCNVTIQLTQQQVLGANLPQTIYTVAASTLASMYGWTVTTITQQ